MVLVLVNFIFILFVKKLKLDDNGYKILSMFPVPGLQSLLKYYQYQLLGSEYELPLRLKLSIIRETKQLCTTALHFLWAAAIYKTYVYFSYH